MTIYNRNRQRAEELAGSGALVAGAPAGACRGQAVITMLADDSALQAVIDEAEPQMAPGLLHISMETVSVDLSERLAQMHAAAGRSYVAAPVLGRPEAAAAARLFILAAGPEPVVERSRPLFEAMGQRTFQVERTSMAHLTKLAVNFLLASMIESLGESFALVRKAGLPADAFLDLITNSISSAPVYKTYGGLIAARKYEPAGFAVPLGLKDVRLVLAAARKPIAFPCPWPPWFATTCSKRLALGQEKQDWASLGRVCARNAGLES